ncbi:protein translocase subunit SecF [methane-oxidizing endosymbiont of Gigantopelta aegis]|uniref:protein translocase subunit SecF n=1 Tax=methane-oxidizing endosymbiont of Gigantopelta aegis TaxID=2794938 RepID=UPI0018DCBB94|nr:protein translocase subunit SecF [methane-oxidizing endosymbiont of Gigantopelta aegis]
MNKQEIDFLGKRKLAMIFSGLLLVVSIASLAMNGLKLGIDFTGGTLVEVGYKQPADLTAIRKALADAGFDDAAVLHFGSSKDVLIRLKPDAEVSNAELSNQVLKAINQASKQKAQLRRVEFVGPQVGDELAEDGGLALLYSIFGILLYVAWRFEYKFALGSVVALVHDVIITLGFFSVFALEFDLTVLAAILAVIGYSLNDTIVVYDRIRENFRKMRKGSSEFIMNVSLNQTLSRTLMTSITTALVLVALASLGGEIIQNFAIALLVGVGIGTYSSIYVASPVVLGLGVSKEDLMIPEKEGLDLDGMP